MNSLKIRLPVIRRYSSESTMKIFQTTQMHLALNGYTNANLFPLNKQQKWIFVETFLSMISYYTHLLCVADSPKEYMYSILMTATETLIVISHISTILKMKEIFVFIDEFEEILNASKLQLTGSRTFIKIYCCHSLCSTS